MVDGKMLTLEKNILKWYVYEFQQIGDIAKPNENAIRAVTNLLLKEIPFEGFPKIADVGSGSGLITNELSRYYPNVYGIDFQHPVSMPFSIDSYTRIDGDFHELASLLPEAVDAVITNHSFEHSYAPFILCCEVFCSLREKGRWFINLPHPTGPHAKISYHHPFVLQPDLLQDLFEATGFKILKMELGDTPYLDYWWILERKPVSLLPEELELVYMKRTHSLSRL